MMIPCTNAVFFLKEWKSIAYEQFTPLQSYKDSNWDQGKDFTNMSYYASKQNPKLSDLLILHSLYFFNNWSMLKPTILRELSLKNKIQKQQIIKSIDFCPVDKNIVIFGELIILKFDIQTNTKKKFELQKAITGGKVAQVTSQIMAINTLFNTIIIQIKQTDSGLRITNKKIYQKLNSIFPNEHLSIIALFGPLLCGFYIYDFINEEQKYFYTKQYVEYVQINDHSTISIRTPHYVQIFDYQYSTKHTFAIQSQAIAFHQDSLFVLTKQSEIFLIKPNIKLFTNDKRDYIINKIDWKGRANLMIGMGGGVAVGIMQNGRISLSMLGGKVCEYQMSQNMKLQNIYYSKSTLYVMTIKLKEQELDSIVLYTFCLK